MVGFCIVTPGYKHRRKKKMKLKRLYDLKDEQLKEAFKISYSNFFRKKHSRKEEICFMWGVNMLRDFVESELEADGV
jgi:hypothetical protein